MIRKWRGIYDGNELYSVHCSGVLLDDKMYPFHEGTSTGDISIETIAYNIDDAYVAIKNYIQENLCDI